MLRTNFIITNNAQQSLFSVPKNKKFLYINTDSQLSSDSIVDSVDLLLKYIADDEDFQIKPYRGYSCEFHSDQAVKNVDTKKTRSFRALIQDHVDEALSHGFDDSISKYRGKSHFVKLPASVWYETFKLVINLIKLSCKYFLLTDFFPSDAQNFHRKCRKLCICCQGSGLCESFATSLKKSLKYFCSNF